MSLVPLGNLSINTALPMVASLNASLIANITAQLPSLTAKLSGSLTITPPVLVVEQIAALTKLLEALAMMLAAGIFIIPPSINASLSLELDLQLGALKLALEAALNAQLAFGAPGIQAYSYTGPADGLGPALSGALSDATDAAALVLVATTQESAVALGLVAGIEVGT